MNQEIKKKWIEALTNGEYKQGQGVLRDNQNFFCCLGVLCDLYHKATGKGSWEIEDDDNYYTFIDERGARDTAGISTAIQVWAEVGHGFGGLGVIPGSFNLASLNDHGSSFERIADIIEENL